MCAILFPKDGAQITNEIMSTALTVEAKKCGVEEPNVTHKMVGDAKITLKIADSSRRGHILGHLQNLRQHTSLI